MNDEEEFQTWLATAGRAVDETPPAPVEEPRTPRPDPSQGGSGEEPQVPAELWFSDLVRQS